MRVRVGNGNGFSGYREMVSPELLSGFRIEGPEAGIVSRSNECKAARCNNGAPKTRSTSVSLPFGKPVGYAKDRPPGDLARIHVDRHEFAPGRFGAWQVILGIPEPRCSRKRPGI